MTTCRDIIIMAMRQSAVIASGEEPTDDEMKDGMDVLQSLYDRWFESGSFGALKPVIATEDGEAGIGERVDPAGFVITLPTTVVECGKVRAPHDLAAISIKSLTGWDNWISDHGSWVKISALDDSDQAPLAGRGPTGLAALVAIDLAEQFGGAIQQPMVRRANLFRSLLLPERRDETEPSDYA